MNRFILFSLFLVSQVLVPASAWAQKSALVDSIMNREKESWRMARQIWQWAEPGYQEKKSSALLANSLELAGFDVKRGVAEIPTAFTATIGAGKPLIGILGEFDALPGLSQEPVPFRKPRTENSWGHACGHHMFGVASASACIALAEQIKKGHIKGTLRYYGCPAEEGGAAKAYMVRAGLFKDCDAVLHWHPGNANTAGSNTCLAVVHVKFRFHGTSAHAAASPEEGRSALDAIELTNHAAQLLREHTPDFTRIHHVITSGGKAPNVIPELCEAHYYIRHPKADVLRKLYPRLLKCAKAGALATETRLEVIQTGGTVELMPNDALSAVVLNNLKDMNDLSYTAEESAFAARIQNTLQNTPPLESISQVESITGGKLSKGSTDVGDVSWAVPTAGFRTACWVPGTPAHSWQAVAAGGMSIGRKGMNLAARVLASSAWDLFHRPEVIDSAKTELQHRLNGQEYKSLLDPEQGPRLDYRNAP